MSWPRRAAGPAEFVAVLLTAFLAACLAYNPDSGTGGAAATMLSPDAALEAFESQTARQAYELVACSASILIEAGLSETSQWGRYELKQDYVAPRTLRFTPIHFAGDGFVKNNLITRLLKLEVEHVEKEQSSQTALSSLNYKFSYKGSAEIDGSRCIFSRSSRGKSGRDFSRAVSSWRRRPGTFAAPKAGW